MKSVIKVMIVALAIPIWSPSSFAEPPSTLSAAIEKVLNFSTFDPSLIDKSGSILVISGGTRRSYSVDQQAAYVARRLKERTAPSIGNFKVLGEIDALPYATVVYQYDLVSVVDGKTTSTTSVASDVWENTPSGWLRLSTVIHREH